MAEINNNIPSFGYKSINNNIEKPAPIEKDIAPENENKKEKPAYVPAADTLGRSQVRPANGGNIAKTVEETVHLMKTNPAICGCSEGVFDNAYSDAIARGKTPNEAYMEALMAEEAMLEICPHN